MDVYLKKIFSAFRLLVIFQMLFTSLNVKAVETCEAIFVASSGVATINSADAELINFITGGLLGLNIKLSVADTEYSSLLTAGIELESYLDTLAVDLSAANKSDAVAANISLVQAIDAAITVLQAQGGNTLAIASLNSIKAQVPVGTFSFSDVIDLNAEDSAVLSTTVNLLDFHMLIVQAFNHQNAISAQNISLNLSNLGLDGTIGPLSVSLGDISAALIAVEGPKLVSGPVGTVFTTSSIRLRILADLVDVAAAPLSLGVASVAVTLTDFEIYADVARANGTVDQLSYLSQTLRLNVTPGVASLYLGQVSDANFNDRTLNSNIDYATEVSPVTIGSIDISVIGSSETIALQAKANANANGSLESLNFISPFPESQTTTAGTSITNTLLTSLISNTELSLTVGPVLVNPTLLLNLVRSLVLDDILSPVISSILTNFVDPVMSALGISIGNATEKVFAINGDSCIPTIDNLNTADPSPVLSGLAYRSTEDSELLTIELNNTTYQENIDFVVIDNQWSLTVPPGDSLSEGVYNVIATVTNGIDSIVDQSNAELTVDLTRPSIQIQNVPTNSSAAFTATFMFSEPVNNFTLDDIVVSNGNASNFTSITSSTYTALISPIADGAVTLDVNANVVQDNAGNLNTVAAQVTSNYEATRSSVIIQGVPVISNSAFTATFVFSSNVTGFILADISVDNGIASNFLAINGSTYTADITPSANGVVTVDVFANVAQDGSGNLNTAATQVINQFDTVPPSVVIQGVPANSNMAFTATFAFSEAVIEFSNGDISLTNATASDFTAVNSSTYSALITPLTDGLVALNVDVGVVQDSAGNLNTAAMQVSSQYDISRPSVAIQNVLAVNSAPFTATFSFSEAVSEFTVSDIVISNGVASNFSVINSSTYSALISPSSGGTVTIDVNANVAQDVAGNQNTAAAQVSSNYIATLPTVTIQNVPANSNTAFTATFVFSEAVTGFEVGDISLINATASAFATVNTSTYTALITPSVQGLVTLNIGINVAQDTGGNFNIAAVPVVSLFDTTRPSVAIQGVQPQNITPFTATFTFSEAVADFIASDITLTNATVSNFTTVSSSSYTALITPIADGTITLNVNANVAQDVAGNLNTAATQVSTEFDAILPTVTIQNVPANSNTAFTATFVFSEAVTGFEVGDISLINATASAFATVNTSTYTALITPSAQGLVTLNVGINVAQDTGGNFNIAAVPVVSLFDTTRPSVAIQGVQPQNITPFTATFTFSEAVADFIASDITLTNATASNFTTVSSSSYTALITPIADGTITLNVNANVAQDVAGNLNTAATQVSTEFDAILPMVTIQNVPANSNTAFTATFVFSEAVTGFEVGDISLINATASAFATVNTSTYTALITPSAQGLVTLNVGINVAQDTGGNFNIAAVPVVSLFDTTRPSVAIQGVQPQNITPFTATFTFSEAVADFIASDITLTNATASNFTTVSSSSYTALITPIADGTITLNVNANVAQDVAGNLNTAATQVSTEFDAILPTVTIQNVPANSNTAFTATFVFSEGVTGFEVGDISLINATASAFATVNTSTYTALITPSAQGLVTLNVGINVAQDTGGNFNIAAVPVVSLFDTTRPSVAIQGVQPQNITPFTATFTFSEAVADFIASDITLTNATASNFTTVSSSSYTALITPIADGTITLNVNANVAQDVAGNLNTAATQVSTEYNGSRPTVSIENVPARANSSFTATFLFSEIVIGFEIGDINVTNANIGNFTVVDGSTYTAIITPTIDGLVTLNVNANVAQGIQGNLNTAATQVSGFYDTSRPTIVIQNVPANSLDAFTATFEFNETVIGFIQSDISLTNATATNFTVVDGNTYTALITPALNGLVTLAVNANVAQDSAGNLNTAAAQVTSEYDASRPSVVIQNIPAATNIAFSAGFVFSEPVSDFAANDIAVTNASITNFTVIDSSNYSALITPSTEGDITIDVNENVVIDNFGNFNTAATQASSIYDITAPDVSILSGPVINSVNQLNYQIEGTCSTSDSLVSVSINTLASRTAACNEGSWELNQDFSTIADGEGAVTINASQSDNAGNIGDAEPVVISKDTEDPTFSLDSVIYSENDALIFIGSSNTEDGSEISIIESTDNNLCTAIVNTRVWSCESAVVLSEGTYDLRAEAEDKAGNLSIIYFSQVVDLDEDNDGIDNSVEGYGDSDDDGIPNAQDSDSDNDGIPDSEEGVGDDDRDTIPNYLDTSLDEDIDGIPDVIEGNTDIDNDGIINAFDIDSDNDGIVDSFEAQVSGNDNDDDGIDDIFDADIGGDDPDGDGISYQAIDTDNDGIADLLDADSDGDRIPDALEAFIGFKDIDNDGIWDRYDQSQTGGVDADNDGIDDLYDADQTNGLDADNDGINDLLLLLNDHNQNFIPDHLEIDSDNDGIHDSVEAQVSKFDHDNDGIDDTFDADLSNEVDTNGDGIIDIFTFIDTDADGVIDMNDLDSDNDGDTDVFEANIQDDDNNGIADAGTPVLTVVLDTDTDNIPDYLDLDKNNDDNFDIQENAYSSFDLNNDGRVDITTDIDGDGIDDSVDGDTQVLGHGDNADSDNDSVLDVIDQDDDNDGIADVTERAFENTANVVNRFYGTNSVSSRGKLNNETRRVIDSDNDGIIDEKDRDSDNDGISDLIENGRPNLTGLDHDRDGIDNAFDADFTGGTDEDQDGVDDTYIVKDTDQDSVPDYLDQDSDNDNISDNIEQLTVSPSGIDANGNGIDDAFDPAFNNNQDDNLDGIDDTLVVLSNPDGDDILNFQDTDSDGDNIRDIDEQAVDFDSDGTPNYLDLDSDNDNITDAIEGVSDFDTDGASNFLDLDSDNDNISDAIEGEADFDTDGASNFLDLDSDNDNISDAIEGEDDFDADGASNFLDLDSDNDDISDEVEGENDFDSDGSSNFLDLDSDNDGISDKVEGVNDFDVDGSSNYLDLDSDGDGISDAEEGDIDTDNDGTPNFLDLDSDNDGVADKDENGDFDGDGFNDATNDQRQVESSLKGSGSFQGPVILLLVILCFIRNKKRSVTVKILL